MAKIKIIGAILSLFFASSLSMAQDAEVSRVNINTSPIGFVLGLYNVGVDVAITSNISIGVNGLFANYDNDEVDIDATGIGIRSIYFFNQVFQDSWYGSLDIGTISVDGEDKDTLETASVDGITTAVKLGYFWRWTNFNIQLGLGVQNASLDIDSSTSTDLKNDLEDLDGISPSVEFLIGFAF